MKTKYVICGAGIGGLTLASVLQQNNQDYILLEKRGDEHAFGSGLSVMGNAMKVLGKYGLDSQIAENGSPMQSFNVYDKKGKLLFYNDFLKIEASVRAPSVCISRERLVKSLMSNIPKERLLFEHNITSMNLNPSGESEILCDNGRTFLANYVIGSDGIHSKVRQQMDLQSEYIDGKYVCLLGIIPKSSTWLKEGEVVHYWGEGIRVGIIDIGKGDLYWWITCNDSLFKGKQWLLEHCMGWNEKIAEVLKRVPKDNDIIEVQAKYLSKISKWTNGNTVLLGDAAHAMLTSLGQGACQAIEDAVCLGELLSTNPSNVPAAFKKYENIRMKRANKIVNMSNRVASYEQWESRFLVSFRNGLFKLIPNKVLENSSIKMMKDA